MPGASIQPQAVPFAPTAMYRNKYGTDVQAGYNLQTGELQGEATFPLGDAANGNMLTIRGGYGGESGPSAFIGFTKRNSDAAKQMIQQNPDEYSIGLDLFGQKRPAGAALGLTPGQMGAAVGMP
jgi:hypothetical protein